MAKWAVAEAKAKFSEVVDLAQKKGPQEITKNGRPVAVVISMDEWAAKERPRRSLAEALLNSPLRGSGLKITRSKWKARPVQF